MVGAFGWWRRLLGSCNCPSSRVPIVMTRSELDTDSVVTLGCRASLMLVNMLVVTGRVIMPQLIV